MAGFSITLVIERGDNPAELLELRPPIGVMIDFEKQFGVSAPATELDAGMFWQHIAWLAHEVDAPDVPLDEWTRTVRLSARDEDIAELRGERDEPEAEREPEPEPELARPTRLPIDRPERPEATVTSGHAAGSVS